MNFVVPFSMELISVEIELGDLLVGNFDALGVGAGIQFRMDLESGRRAGGRNQTHYDLKTNQWLATPVLRNARKEAMFGFVPFCWRPGKNRSRVNAIQVLGGTAWSWCAPPAGENRSTEVAWGCRSAYKEPSWATSKPFGAAISGRKQDAPGGASGSWNQR